MPPAGAGSNPADAADFPPAERPAPGRPPEIELASNRWLIHPLAARLVDALAKTPVTPNQVSVAGLAAAAAAAACIVTLGGPGRAIAVLAFLGLWHVLDGADGALARRTGRVSAIGELVDGVCDHAAQGLIYVALAWVLARRAGWVAWPLATLSSVCHFVQANAYESWRKSYRHFGYGGAWMAQTFGAGERPKAGVLGRTVASAYLALSNLFLPSQKPIAAAVGGGGLGARDSYKAIYAPSVRRAACLGSNTRTAALVVALLLGSAVWYFAFEIVVLDLALLALAMMRRRLDRAFLAGERSARAA